MKEIYKKLGELLALERQRRGLDLEEIAGELKIPEGTLQAIEQGDPSPLPSELYFKLFAKSYSSA
jgi:cytoskeletal protein RodZ